MMKMIGLFCVFCSGAGAGILLSLRLSGRVRLIRSLLLLLEKVRTLLRFYTPTEDIITALAVDDRFACFPFLQACQKRLAVGEDFPSAWAESLHEHAGRKNTAMGEPENEFLRSLGQTLGTGDAESQLSLLSLQDALLRQTLAEAEEKQQRMGRLYRSMGILTGIWAILLLI